MRYESVPDHEAFTPATFIEKADDLFRQYLETLRSDGREPTLLQPFFDDLAHGLGIGNKLKQTIDADWSSTEPLTSNDYFSDNRGLGMEYSLLVATDPLDPSVNHAYAAELNTSPAIIGLRRWLGKPDSDSTIGDDHLRVWGGFIHSLRDYYWQEVPPPPPTPEEIVAAEFYITLRQELFVAAEFANDDIALAAEIQSGLNACEELELPLEQQAQLITLLSGLYDEAWEGDDVEQEPKLPPNEHAMAVRDTLISFLGSRYPEAPYALSLRLARILRGGEAVEERIVLPDNFLFTPPPQVLNAEDTFPRMGTMKVLPGSTNIGDMITRLKDFSVFDCNGVKVYWGDLEPSDITHLKGTYYVVAQSLSYHDVPRWAILIDSGQVSQDDSRPSGSMVGENFGSTEKPMLDINYIQLYADGAIVGGQYIKNPSGSGG